LSDVKSYYNQDLSSETSLSSESISTREEIPILKEVTSIIEPQVVSSGKHSEACSLIKAQEVLLLLPDSRHSKGFHSHMISKRKWLSQKLSR
jgi:hypothetical protein